MSLSTSQLHVFYACTGGVVKDQAEADKDMSLKQRAALAVGKPMSKARMQHYNVNVPMQIHYCI